MPSQASSAKVLRNFKGNFRAATASIMAAGGWSAVAQERGTPKLNPRERVEYYFELGSALNQETLPSGKKVYDFFDARLRLRLVTARRDGLSSPDADIVDQHELFMAEAADFFAEERQPFTEALLPYYAVKMLMPLGTRSDFDPLYMEDHTDVEFRVQFGIRSTAWPDGY